MNREDILKAAQAEQQDIGEFENTIVRKGIAYGTALGIGICLVMVICEMFILKKMDFGKPTIICAISAFSFLYEGIKNKSKRKIAVGIVVTILAVFFVLLYIGAMLV